MEIIKTLTGIITEWQKQPFGIKNTWARDSDVEVYIRNTRRVCGDVVLSTLDIASINVTKPGRGFWTKFIKEVHAINPWEATYVENVLNQRFERWFVKHGWTQQKDILPPSFFLLTGRKPNDR